MSALVPALAKSRGRVDPSIFGHVIRLVQHDYLPSASTSGQGYRHYSGIPTSSHTQTQLPIRRISRLGQASSSSHTQQHHCRRRSYSASAQAVVEEHDHDNNHFTYLPRSSRNPRVPRPSVRHAPNRQLAVAPEWANLPLHFAESLSDGSISSPTAFRAEFERFQCKSGQLASSDTLQSVFRIFLRSAEPSQWAWLSGQLGHMLAAIEDAGQFHPDIPGLGNSMRAYCLVELGQKDEARGVLNRATGRSTVAVNHSVRSVGLMKLGEQDLARDEMVKALRRAFTRSGNFLTPVLAECFAQYAEQATDDDMLHLFRKAGYPLRTFLIDANSVTTHPAFIDVWNSWFAALPVTVLRHDTSAHADFIHGYQLSIFLRNSDRTQEALALFWDIHDRGRVKGLSKETCVKLVTNLCWADLVDEVKTVLDIVKSNLPTPNSLLRDISNVYARTHTTDDGTVDQLWEAGRLGNKSSESDRIAMASIRAAKGDLSGAISVFHGVPDPTIQSRHIRRSRVFLQAALAARNLGAAEQYLSSIIALRADRVSFNSVLQMAVDMDEPQRAKDIFAQYEEAGHTPGLIAHTTLIGLHARRGEPRTADFVFDSMAPKGIEPDATAWAALLNAHVEAGDWDGVGERFKQMPKEYRSDGNIVSIVMKALVLKGAPMSQVSEVFRAVEQPTAYHWSFVIQAASDHRDLRTMEALFLEMETQSQASVDASKPGVYIYSILLNAYIAANDTKQTRAYYDKMLKKGIIPSSVTYSKIITSYANGTAPDSLTRAQEFAMSIHRLSSSQEDSQPPSIDKGGKRRRARAVENLFSPLVVAAGREGNTSLAAEAFDMITQSHEPSIPMYSRYLDVWRKADEPGMVMRVWAEVFALACRTVSTVPSPKMKSKGRSKAGSDPTVIPQREPYNALAIPLTIVLVTLGREKRLLDIRRVWDDVRTAGFGFDAVNFNQLAVSLAQAGDVEGAFDVVENVLLDPSDSTQATGLDMMTSDPATFGSRSRIPDATEPAFRPPNRRSESISPFDHGQPSGMTVAEHLSRPATETDWRPHFRTLMNLGIVVSQLESSPDNRAWMGLATTEEGEDDLDGEFHGSHIDTPTNSNIGDAEQGGLVALPHHGTYVRDTNDGRPKKTSARGLLMKLNRKYSKAMALVMFHRKKMSDKRRNNMLSQRGRSRGVN